MFLRLWHINTLSIINKNLIIKGVCMASVERRTFLRLGMLGLAGGALLKPSQVFAANPAIAAPRELSFHSLHTGEKLTAVFWEKGRYVPDALQAIDNILRDHRSGEVHKIDYALLQTLYETRTMVEAKNKPLEIISGYRSPASNAMLRGKSNGGVAKRSLHMLGKAIDIRIPGVGNDHIRKAGLQLKRGGVGYYPQSGFVHLDTGAVRAWAGA
jgi:uncharacterized protein YcbK (DUF882 family)